MSYEDLAGRPASTNTSTMRRATAPERSFAAILERLRLPIDGARLVHPAVARLPWSCSVPAPCVPVPVSKSPQQLGTPPVERAAVTPQGHRQGEEKRAHLPEQLLEPGDVARDLRPIDDREQVIHLAQNLTSLAQVH